MKRFIKWFMSLFSVREERCDEDKVEDELAKYDVKLSPRDSDYYFPRTVGKIKTKLKIFDKELLVPNFKIRYEPLGEVFNYDGERHVTVKEITFTRGGIIEFTVEEEVPLDQKHNETSFIITLSRYGDKDTYHKVFIDKDFPYETFSDCVVNKNRSRRFIVTDLCYVLIKFHLGLEPIPRVLSMLSEEERLEFYEKFSYVTKDISDWDLFKIAYGEGISFQEAVEKNLEILKTIEYTL